MYDSAVSTMPLHATKRRSIVYVYDWLSQCKKVGLCHDSATVAFRPAMPYPYGDVVWHMRDGLQVSNTDQFASSSLFDSRLSASQWRTHDPAQAELFYIAYDPLIDGYHEPVGPHGLYQAHKEDWMLNTVLASPWMKRRQGRDHFMSIAHVRAFNHWNDLVDDELANVTKLTIENVVTLPKYMDALGRSTLNWVAVRRRRNGTSRAAFRAQQSSVPFSVSYWATVPYPSFLHPTPAYDGRDPCMHHRNKDVLVAMAFSPNLEAPAVRDLRQRLLAECLVNDDICVAIAYAEHQVYNTTAFADVYTLYRRARYCVVPMGDSLTSKRLFDAVSSCCLPVLAGVNPVHFRNIYQFLPFRRRMAELITHTIAKAKMEDDFAALRRDNGTTFRRRVAKLREHFFALSYATADHADKFDAVDWTVAALAEAALY